MSDYDCIGCLCKTAGCPATHVVKILGPRNPERGPYLIPDSGPWERRCSLCGRSYKYTGADMKPGVAEQPPPGWEPWF